MTDASKELDQYFTPPKLAQELISAITIRNPLKVGDFAAGDGELLRAAVSIWPDIECIAVDIDNDVIQQIQVKQPNWLATCLDFMDSTSRSADKELKDLAGTLPLIVLNPPFSCRGGTILWTEIANTRVPCSPALAFVVAAASFLKTGGQLVAIVPYGMIKGEKDKLARQLLRSFFGFEVVNTYRNGGFAKCSPRTAIIRLTAGDSKAISDDSKNIKAQKDNSKFNKIKLCLNRGKVSNNIVTNTNSKNNYPFLHTKNLSNNKLIKTDRYLAKSFKSFQGPAIILPRVGRPQIGKVVLIEGAKAFVPSECLFIIECGSFKEAAIVYQCIIDN